MSISHKKLIFFATFLLLAAGVFFVAGKGKMARALTGEATGGEAGRNSESGWAKNIAGDVILSILGYLLQAVVWVAGKLMAGLMLILFAVARYNGFIKSSTVTNGWMIIRDLCNIFFIVIFLVMTVATVLGIDEYSYSRILKKLLIMAVLINFSKLICGLIIDASQVIMMTFLNAIGDFGGGYLSYMLGVDQMMDAISGGVRPGALEVIGSYILVVIYLIVAVATILVITLVLVQRIVMLWIYVVLSPFAYFLSTFPSGASYASKWWSEFTKYVTIGPIIAFFLWLSFTSLGNVKNQTEIDDMITKMSEKEQAAVEAGTTAPPAVQIGLTEAGSSTHMLKFIIAIAMLLGGLMVAQTVGGMAGNFAGAT
ncbi:MAG: hypothetical protein V1860_03250, partial [bacterium]